MSFKLKEQLWYLMIDWLINLIKNHALTLTIIAIIILLALTAWNHIKNDTEAF